MKGTVGKKYKFYMYTDQKMFTTMADGNIIPIYSHYIFTKVKDSILDKIQGRSMYQLGDTDIILDLASFEAKDMIIEI